MSVTLNGHTYTATDMIGSDGRGYNETNSDTGLTQFPDSIFTDMLAELASATSLDAVSPGAAGGILVSNGSAWIRAVTATITSAGVASFSSATISKAGAGLQPELILANTGSAAVDRIAAVTFTMTESVSSDQEEFGRLLVQPASTTENAFEGVSEWQVAANGSLVAGITLTGQGGGTVDTAVSGALAVTGITTHSTDVVCATGALATNATSGFLYIPTCAGVPSGTPSGHTGTIGLLFDTTNNDLYVYDGAWLKVAMAA